HYIVVCPVDAAAGHCRGRTREAGARRCRDLATCGLLMLVHVPGGIQTGWNRGDIETLLCAVLCAGHLIATTHFSRASSGWALAWVQILITGIVSAVVTIFLPAPNGFQGVIAALRNRAALAALAYMVTFNTMYAFWGLS